MLAQAPELVLPAPARSVLESVQRAGGRLRWEQLERRFGPLREMGAGRRDRLKPWRDPASPLEMLWYRGLLGRAFGDTPSGPLEFGFIPTDLAELLPQPEAALEAPPGEPAPKPRKFAPAQSYAVDDATTLLAELRRGPGRARSDGPVLEPERRQALQGYLLQPETLDLLLALVGGLLGEPARVKQFLTGTRGQAQAWLQRAWRDSVVWNDLERLGSLQIAGSDWPNDPIASRHAALDCLGRVPPDTWWSMAGFVEAVHRDTPDFLRPAGGFESWYLQRADSGEFLIGFAHWEAVEGAYLRYLIDGPMRWLGGTELSDDGERFRIAATAGPLFGDQAAPQLDESPGATQVRADGGIRVARGADRSLRYQIARFAEWEGADAGAYRYRLSAVALQRAAQHGLTAAHALSVLSQAAGDRLPAGPARALERFGANGPEAALRRELVLEVGQDQVLDQLARHRSTRRMIQTRLGPTRAVVLEKDWQPLAAAALKLGLLIQEPE